MTGPTDNDPPEGSEPSRDPGTPNERAAESTGWGPPQQPQSQPPQWGQPQAAPAQQPAPQQYGSQQYPTQQYGPQEYPTQQYRPTGGQPPAQSASQWSTQQLPTQPQDPSYGLSGSQPYGQYGQATPQQQYAGAPGGLWGDEDRPTQGGPPAKKRNKKLFIIIAAVLAVVLVGGGLFFFLSGEDITYQGRDIIEPEKVLTDAESTLDGIVEERNGAANDETSCYFVARNADTTDIEDGLVCGPVLFVDGDEGQPYLTFPIEGSAGDGDARLTVAAAPDSPEPAELANRALLRRPDGASPPDGNGGLAVPEPPPAEEGIFVAIPSEGIGLESTPSTARIGSPTMSIEVTGIGEPGRYGQGDDARRPAEGEKFVAFEIVSAPGELGPVADFSVAVQAGDEDPIPLPDDADLEAGPTALAISVPEDTGDVSLVVTEGGLVQRLSLTTGEPDPGNIAVWQRANRTQDLAVSQALTIRASQPGFVTEDLPSTLTVTGVQLLYFAGPGARAPSAPNQAFLVLNAEFTIDGQAGIQLDPPYWTLTQTDGTVLPAVNLAVEPDRILIGFEVPANFTEGTMSVGGVATSPSGLTLDTLGVIVPIPVSISTG